MERPYPLQDNGQPVPVEELGLEPSRLDPRKFGSLSLHHYWFNSGFYESDFIFNSLRNLKGEHVWMLKDQHNLGRTALHAVYGPMEHPTYEYAMDRLEEAVEVGEPFEVWDRRQKKYKDIEFDRACWAALKRYYNTVTERNGVLMFDMAAD